MKYPFTGKEASNILILQINQKKMPKCMEISQSKIRRLLAFSLFKVKKSLYRLEYVHNYNYFH